MKDYNYAYDYAAILIWIDNEEREARDKDFQELINEILCESAVSFAPSFAIT